MPKAFRKKKKFINKKEATTYRLIPGYREDSDTPEVLSPEEIEARKEEQRKYGIFFDDTYNYMKHLRSVSEQATLVNNEQFHIVQDTQPQRDTDIYPSSIREFFSSDVTEEETLDPDVLSALDSAPLCQFDEKDTAEDGDFLEDEFILKAGGVVSLKDIDECEEGQSFIEGESDELADDDDEEWTDEDYDSDNDSQLPKTSKTVEEEIIEAQTALILKNFEEGYGFRCSNQISDDDEDEETVPDYESLRQIIQQDKSTDNKVSWSEVFDNEDKVKIDTSRYQYDDSNEYEWKEVPVPKPKFDCVSILSLNSNTRNLPTDLIPPKLKSKKSHTNSECQSVSSRKEGLSLREIEKEMQAKKAADKASTFRPKDESTEERKARKKALKDERKDRRQEKKANRIVFSMENEKLKRETAAVHKAVKGLNIS